MAEASASTTTEVPEEPSVLICATVPTGLETIAAEEFEQKFQSFLTTRKLQQGKILFQLPLSQAEGLKTIRSVENLYAIVAQIPDYCSSKEETIAKFLKLPSELDWSIPLECWKSINRSPNKIIKPLSDEILSNVAKYENDILKFRATCHRAGSKSQHSFESPEVGRVFGGACQDFFGWGVSMKQYDVELFVWVAENQSIMVGITLTKESLAKRNIVKFGITTLRPSISHCIARTVAIKAGEIVIDPMCGCGSIPIEASASWPHAFYIGADIFPLATYNTAENVNYNNSQRAASGLGVLPLDPIIWDATRLPLRTGSVDVILTDLPYGKRMGSKVENWNLYPALLSEFGRVCRPSSSRMALLTQDSKSMANVLKNCQYWKRLYTFWINHGGLRSSIYVLARTALKC